MSVEQSAKETRRRIIEGRCPPTAFREALEEIAPHWRDDWLDLVLGVGEVPPDADLPSGSVPYLPAPIDAIVRIADAANLRANETLVDVGAGVGRAAFAFHLLTGARFVAVELQPHLCDRARELADTLGLVGEIVQADATVNPAHGDVQFLYCPFDNESLRRWFQSVDIGPGDRVATLDIGLPDAPGVVRDELPWSDVRIYRMH